MNLATHCAASLLMLVSLAGCKAGDSSSAEEGAASVSATVAAAPGQAQQPAGKPGATPGQAGATPGQAGAQAPTTSVTVANKDKKVDVGVADGGTSLNLQNDGGKGSIDVNKDGTTIKGKNGKSVTLPGLPR